MIKLYERTTECLTLFLLNLKLILLNHKFKLTSNEPTLHLFSFPDLSD